MPFNDAMGWVSWVTIDNDNARGAENECDIKIQKIDLILLGRVRSVSTAQNSKNYSGTTIVDPTYGFETTAFELCSRIKMIYYLFKLASMV